MGLETPKLKNDELIYTCHRCSRAYITKTALLSSKGGRYCSGKCERNE